MIAIKNLHKTYNPEKPNAFHALKGVSAEIADGELVAVIGKSGAGKSTLLHILGCIDSFEEGSFSLDGTETAQLNDKELSHLRNEKIGIVLQDFALIEEQSAIENVMVPLYFAKKKLPMAKRRELAKEALEKVGIGELAEKEVNKLSGGQKQRVAIARAIVNHPSLLLADEPTGALDTGTAEEIMALLTQLNAEGTTVVIVTHDPTVASKCRRIITISDGLILHDETPTP